MTTTVTTTTQPTVAPARPRITIAPTLRHMLRRLTSRITNWSGDRSEAPPTGLPGDYPQGAPNPVDTYTRGAVVWAYIAGRWLPAHVTEIDANSVMVTYQVPGTGETSLEVVHSSHLAPRGNTPKSAEPSTSAGGDAGQARATLLIHHADEHGMCKGCVDLAHFCWAPCPAARDAMRILDEEAAQLAGAR